MPAIKYKNEKGAPVPSVTTVIKNLGWNCAPLMAWANKVGREQGVSHWDASEGARNAGTLAHAMIEAELKGRDVDTSEATMETLQMAEMAYSGWTRWRQMVSFELIASEVSLVSETHQFGGTLDIAGVLGEVCILDLKTSPSVYAEHKIQVRGYGELWDENNPDKLVEAYYILQLGRIDGSFHHHYWPKLDAEWRAFKYCLGLHNLKPLID
jgi:hypothetical protein